MNPSPSPVTLLLLLLAVLGGSARAGPLVLEFTSSPVPFSRVIDGDGGKDVSLILDREEYDPLDVTAVAVIRLRAESRPIEDLSLRLQLHDDRGAKVLEETLSGLRGPHLDLTLELGSIPLGNHTLSAVLLDGSRTQLGEASAPLRKRVKRKQSSEPDRRQIALRVWPAEEPMEPDWPIQTGVPFPQGTLFSQDRVRLLDDDGSEVPCQTSVRSTWNRHGSIRWLGLDFIGRLEKRGARYTLEFGRDVRRAPAAKGLTVEEGEHAVRVDTGPLQFTVRKRGFNLIDEVRLHGIEISRQDGKTGLELTDHEGSVYRASSDPDVRVVVEEVGPVRATIRASGWYVKEGTAGERLSPFLPTDRLCRHDTRITAFSGKPYVTVQQALVVTFDSRKVRLKHIGTSLRVEGASSGEFGLDGRAVAAPGGKSVRLYQPASVDGRIESGNPSGPDFRVVEKGSRGDGWVKVSGTSGALTICATDLWQLYPKELELSGDHVGLNIWPRYGRSYDGVNPLDLGEIYKAWWCHTGPELAFTLPGEVYEIEKKVWPEGGESVYEGDRLANAQGVAIENNLLLAFSAAAETAADRPARLNATWQYGPHAWADPGWVCDSGAFGRIAPRDEKRFPTAEAYLEHGVAIRLAAQEYARDYGMFNYFCIHADNSHFRQGRWGLDRVWKDHHGAPRVPWLLYARSGDPRHLQFARRNSRHVMNVDTVHYVTPDYDLSPEKSRNAHEYGPDHHVGAHYGCYGLQHWGDKPCVACMWVNGEYDQLFWNYYATGNRRALDVAMEWVGAMKVERYAGETGREFSSVGAELMEAYQATWDAGLLELIDNTARAIGAAHFHFERDDRKLGNHWLNMAPFVDRYLPFTGNENFRRRTLAWALDRSPYDGPRANTQALKYHETGDASHLRECLPDLFFLSLRYSAEPPRITDRSSMYGWLKICFRATHWPTYLRALEDAGVPLFVASRPDEPFPGSGRVVERRDGGKGGPVSVIRPGSTGSFGDQQVWYFRTAPGQRKLELEVRQRDAEGAVHIRTADGSRIVGHIGADGHGVGGDGTIATAVDPDTLYYLATSGGPDVTPREHPLIVARSAEEWFHPDERP